MKHQAPVPTLGQIRGLERYKELQRTARSEFRSNANNVVPFRCAPGVPGSQPQTLSWADTKPFWASMALVALAVFAAHCAGWL
jgi:hypothetical protein